MDSYVTGVSPPGQEDEKLKDTESAANFQRFVYDLFEKNGVLNDLRAYLRGQIVDVLKSAQAGESPTCQKHFTQRLDLTYQALNMLIAEYLLRLEFSYSLSVFVSEIPLANMVFSFAKKLMSDTNGDFEDLRFKDSDVWSILSYLGIKCDSENASRILEMYNGNENLSLLFCILKCTRMYHPETCFSERASSSSESLSGSMKSLDLPDKEPKASTKQNVTEKCQHYIYCKRCRAKMSRLKEKYRAKKKYLVKKVKSSDGLNVNVESFMRHMGVMERDLIDEMFQQLKSVYEAEVEMMKQDEDKKIKRSLASHAVELQKQREQMEESFKSREEELERSVQDKKKFLWGLARTLRDQHAAMQRAMHAVKTETDRLSAKEDSLKTQLLEAEGFLRKRGEEMRQQISDELVVLEGHLEAMKKERDSISRERADLDKLKIAGNDSRVQDLNSEELKSHYNLLKDELTILKKYLETARLDPKCVIERGTYTDPDDVGKHIVLNNEQDVEIKPTNQVINDLKKQKNVNISSNMEDVNRDVRARSRSMEPATLDRQREYDIIDQLRDENERLKTFARQQRDHIDELTSHGARLQSELTATHFRADTVRPRTAPTVMPDARLNTRANVNSVGWQKGAGEEISVFSNAQPRILLPGDTVPFVGLLRDRNNDNRRYLINQWRAMRRRVSPNKLNTQSQATPPKERPEPSIPTSHSVPSPSAVNAEGSSHPMNTTYTFTAVTKEKLKATTRDESIEKSPEPEIKDTKERLKSTPRGKETTVSANREKSPDAVLREARLRLRKLEIEAAAVEEAYRRFRHRRDSTPTTHLQNDIPGIDLPNISQHGIKGGYKITNIPYSNTDYSHSTKRDFDKYLREYQNKITTKAFNVNIKKADIIPDTYKVETDHEKSQRENYLETPLTEFRKLYSLKSPVPKLPVKLPEIRDTISEITIPVNDINGPSDTKINSNIDACEKEINKLEDKINKESNHSESEMGGVIANEVVDHSQSEMGGVIARESPKKEFTEDLIVKVETVSECNSLKLAESGVNEDLMVVVESSIDVAEIDPSKTDLDEEMPQISVLVTPRVSPNGAKDIIVDIEETSIKSMISPQDSVLKSVSVTPEKVAILTNDDVMNDILNVKSASEDAMSKEDSIPSISEKYQDDFSVDGHSDHSALSPVSLPKTSEDDNFWNSN